MSTETAESAHTSPAKVVFQVDNLDCADCAAKLETAIGNLPQVNSAHIDFMRARLTVVPAEGGDVVAAVQSQARVMGHSARPEGQNLAGAHDPRTAAAFLELHGRDMATALSGGFILLAVLAGWLGLPYWAETALFLLSILSGGYYVSRAAWANLRSTRSLDMNALMTLAVLGAMFIGEWLEGALVIFLFSLGETLENYTMNRARSAISTLVALTPQEAIRLDGNRQERVPVEDILTGDLILVPPGERLSMDGIVRTGESAVNQAPITGESIPADKAAGDPVYAGTINGAGALTIEVTQLAADNTISRIIQMVEEAQAQKAPAQRFVDVFARYYTPIVVGIALAVVIVPTVLGIGEWTDWLYRGLVLLVIGCPCALVISTPVSIVAAIAAAARAGVVIKGGSYLEELGKVKVVAFDKTGTLTRGEPMVTDARCAVHGEPMQPEECADCRYMLTAAAAIESQSKHPLAQAVVREARRQGLDWTGETVEAVEAVGGRGVRGTVSGHPITLGSHSFIHENGGDDSHDPSFCKVVEQAEADGKTVMVMDCASCGVQGYIAVADTVREDSAEAIRELKRIGIHKTVMLTGDNEITAGVIGRLVNVDEIRARLLPQDKVTAVEALAAQYGRVAMVGDGINDAPALAKASVGIAMGAMGSAAALETADVALMTDDLLRIPFVVGLGRQALNIIRQNIAFALALKAVFLVLAIQGSATLWMAVFADVGASLIVVLNGMRLLRARPQASRGVPGEGAPPVEEFDARQGDRASDSGRLEWAHTAIG